MKIFYCTLCFILFTNLVHAQYGIDGVSYQLKYNKDSCHYEVLLIVNAGSATTLIQRRQFNANVSFVMPSNTDFSVKRSYWPRSISGDDVLSPYWLISSVLPNPAAAPTKKFVGVVPNLGANGGAQYYNTLSAGDTVRLFSININTVANCNSDIRLFANNIDPSSSAPGMGGLDFSNGFTIENPANQTYENNAPQVYPPKPVITAITSSCATGIFIDLNANNNLGPQCSSSPLHYAWTGPNGFSQAGSGPSFQDVNISPSSAANNGNYKVLVSNTFGCKDSTEIEAYSKPNAGPDLSVCAGTTTTISGTSPNTGTWAPRLSPANPAGATWSSLANGQMNVTFSNTATGNYFFVYTTNGCTDTMRFTVTAKPTVGYATTPFICLSGGTSTITLTSNQVGTWVSNNPAVAIVNPTTGIATAVTAGLVNFTFTNSTTTCQSTTINLTIDPKPNVTQSTDTICLSGTAAFTPTVGGTWTSTVPSVVIVTNGGVLTAVAPGVAGLYFRSATGAMCTSDTLSMTVLPKPVATIATSVICVGSTTNAIVTPSQVGTWSSTNPVIASINNVGVIIGLSAGTSTFIFQSALTGCVSDPSAPLKVDPAPTVSGVTAGARCVGSTLNLSPNTGCTWVSNNPAVATVTTTGFVTAIDQGTVNFTCTQISNGCSATTINMVVTPLPVINALNPIICVGTSTALFANSMGTWTRIGSAPYPITYSASPSPTVTGVLAGTGRMRFVSSVTTCADTLDIQVNAGPIVSITGNDSICIGGTTQLSPSSGGIWTSSNNSAATVNQAGLVTGVGLGSATFTFTQTNSGCMSSATDPVTVIGGANLSFSGPSGICVGNTTQVITTPVTAGTWTSSSPGVATISTSGLITGISPGFAALTFTDASLGCVIIMAPNVSVFTKPIVSIDRSNVCIGQTAQLSPSTGGTWASTNSSVAFVTNAGLVTGVSEGSTQFIFTSSASSCPSDPSATLTVTAGPTISSSSDLEIELSERITLTSNEAGTWTASPEVNVVSSTATTIIIEGKSAGLATVSFTSSDGCIKITEVNVLARAQFTISGLCFTDLNANNIYDSQTDFPLPNVAITVEGSSTIYFTNALGAYTIPVDSGLNTITYQINFGTWVSNVQLKNINAKTPRTYVFTGFVPTANATAAATGSISTPPLVCKTFMPLQAQAFNAGSKLLNGYLIIDFDDDTYLYSSSPNPSGGQNNYLVWPFYNLPPGQIFSPQLEIWVPDPMGIGSDSLEFTLKVANSDTGDTLYTQTIVVPIDCQGSVNNNFTSNYPDRYGDENYTLTNEEITYRIDFQNREAITATEVIISNEIDARLNLSSLKILKASHSFDVKYRDGKMFFVADSILLSANGRADGGKGYITFSLGQNPGIPENTKIYHKAYIQLDNGQLSESNLVVNTIVNFLPCDIYNDEVVQQNNSLVAPLGDTYKWYACNDAALILSTQATFTPTTNGQYFAVIEGSNCKTTTSCIDYIMTSTDDDASKQVEVYPNPVNNTLHIKTNLAKIDVKVYDVLGRKIHSGSASTIDVSSWHRGTYLVCIKYDGGEISKMIVKE